MKNKAEALSLIQDIHKGLNQAVEEAPEIEEGLGEVTEKVMGLETMIQEEPEVEPVPPEPLHPDPVGEVLADSVAGAEELTLSERSDLFIRLRAKPDSTTQETQTILNINNAISLMSVSQPDFLATVASADGQNVYWTDEELDENGEYHLVIRVLMSQVPETGLLEVINQNRPSSGPPPHFDIATMTSESCQLEISGTDDITLLVVGTTLSAVLSV